MDPDWIAISDQILPAAVGEALLASGSFVLEFDAPPDPGTVLLDYQVGADWPRAFSIFVDAEAGIVLLHRQGERLLRHYLAGPLDFTGESVARIVFSWDGPGRSWGLALDLPASGRRRTTRGRDPVPMPLADLVAICAAEGETRRHAAVQWFGVRRGALPPSSGPWIGPATPVATPSGPFRADALRVGDMILTATGDAVAVRAVQRMDLPGRGSFSPVLLRAPYFARRTDLLVAPDQLVLLSGAEVEYLFGEEHVLAEARHLTDGRAALLDQRRAITTGLSVDLGQPDLISSDGCCLLSQMPRDDAGAAPAPYRVLHGFETVPLLALLGRGFSRNAA